MRGLYPTKQIAQAVCDLYPAEFAGVFERADDHVFYYQIADEPMVLYAEQQQGNAYLVSMFRHGQWEAFDHVLNAVGERSYLDMALLETGGTYWGDAPENSPYAFSLELEYLFKLLESESVADRVNALFILSSWTFELLPDMIETLGYIARSDPHSIVRQWADFVLDPLTKPVPPRLGE